MCIVWVCSVPRFLTSLQVVNTSQLSPLRQLCRCRVSEQWLQNSAGRGSLLSRTWPKVGKSMSNSWYSRSDLGARSGTECAFALLALKWLPLRTALLRRGHGKDAIVTVVRSARRCCSLIVIALVFYWTDSFESYADSLTFRSTQSVSPHKAVPGVITEPTAAV